MGREVILTTDDQRAVLRALEIATQTLEDYYDGLDYTDADRKQMQAELHDFARLGRVIRATQAQA